MTMIDENANGEASLELQGPLQEEALQDALNAALADPAMAALARGNAPIAVAAGSPARVIYANTAALALFGVADCAGLTGLLFSPDEAGQLWRLAETLAPGAAPRLERVRSPVGSGSIMLLCRRTPGDTPLFVFSGLGRRGGFSRALPFVPPVAEGVPKSLASTTGSNSVETDETAQNETAADETVSVDPAVVEAAAVDPAELARAESFSPSKPRWSSVFPACRRCGSCGGPTPTLSSPISRHRLPRSSGPAAPIWSGAISPRPFARSASIRAATSHRPCSRAPPSPA